ncbi:MAG TPA: glycosyltransferase [Sphingomonadaceae bacterium]|nr:glycosyltransferase [Sphingomonadaceae bacterium]
MARDDKPLLICDLTQSYSPNGGGGISTYLREKRNHVLSRTDHRILQIVPGPEDRIVENGRSIWVEIGAEPVRGSPNYRFIMRTRKVREVLEHYRPDIIESLCPWVLPWTAINHRRKFPETTLVAGYRTDFPNAHVYRVGKELAGETIASMARWLIMGYAEITYREFDRVYTLGEDAKEMLATRKIDRVDVLELGVDLSQFDPARRDPDFRHRMGLGGTHGPLLIYAGRIDNEKRADRVVEMMKHLPPELGAGLVMVGDGKLRDRLVAETAGMPVAFPGFMSNREDLAQALASSDIYVSAMADETFGVSVVEAQASGLPVVGVASGAMPARVPPGLGLLGPVDDVDTMARNVLDIWNSNHDAIGAAARNHVVNRYSWDRTFYRLFNEIYPVALAHTRQRLRGPASGWQTRPASELLRETV